MISSKENVRRSVECQSPAYLPCSLEVNCDQLFEKNPAKVREINQLQKCLKQDFTNCLSSYQTYIGLIETDGVTRWKDDWGTGWSDDGHGAKPDHFPLSDGYDHMDHYSVPDPYKPGRFDNADGIHASDPDLYARGETWFTLFERLWMLRGFTNLLMDPYLDYDNFCSLRDKVVEFDLAVIDQWVERKVDAVFFSDDWGSQSTLLIDPDDWRTFFKPSYRKLFSRVRDGGAHVWMHLCGNITAILPDLIDLGLNVLNPVQPQPMDVHLLSREYGGKICFNGGVDVQGTLINGTPADVRSEVDRLVDLFGRFDGGYIGGTSHTIMPETPLDNVIAVYEAFINHQNS